jgi:hypothetical protein
MSRFKCDDGTDNYQPKKLKRLKSNEKKIVKTKGGMISARRTVVGKSRRV